jgi:glycosyltransferase involved in cell wall biosynthesis
VTVVRFPEDWASLDVALSHDWLTGMRGGERVLEWLCRGFPRATVLTLIHNPAAVSDVIAAHPVRTSPLQRLPGIGERYRRLLPLFPWAFGRLRAPPADLLISTSHCLAKAVRAPPGARHLCYCFTPMRYAWTFYEEYFGRNPLKRRALAPLLARLREADLRANERVDRFVTLSRHVQERIRRFYGREADVVYPPVDVDFFTPGDAARDAAAPAFDLIVSALVPYKRIDLAVRAYSRTGFPLKVVGVGTEFPALRAAAAPNVEFLGRLEDGAVRALYRACRLLVFPGEEDFGIVPVEAQACGRPVVAFGRGGARETVEDGVTGLFFDAQEEDALIAAVESAAARAWDAAAIRRRAERFHPQAFVDGLAASIRACRA